MGDIINIFSYFADLKFIFMVFLGAFLGLFVGAIPGLSVSMATALLVSITYTWHTKSAIATIMGLYVVGVFSGAISAILINIPGAPSSVVTTLDGFPLASKGESYKAIKYATVYSFVGSLFSFIVLLILAKPVSSIALKFTPMDYFLLAFFGLTTVGSLTAENFQKGLLSAMLGLIVSMVGIDPIMGTPRLTFGSYDLHGGISIVPALIGLFGFSEVLVTISQGLYNTQLPSVDKSQISIKEIFKHFPHSIYYSLIGTFVGALPGAGGPVASFIAYSEAKRIIKNPSAPFGKGAVEGIVASESANNAVIGGALIPMLTLAVPGDAVTAIILSVFYIHGLQPGPMFIRNNPDMFYAILAGGLIGCIFLLVLGLFLGPRISKVVTIPKRILLPIIMVLCIIGAFAGNNRMFDILIMIFFGVLGYIMRRRGYPVAPMTLALVLGGVMDSNFRRAISLAATESNKIAALFGRPITLFLLGLTVLSFLSNAPIIKRKLLNTKD